ncbi:short-chain dehydrogenase [Metarhizobium album]|uniref:Short-chain dehydrogenase n=1 Tax=Metarhizobium album TaxID=2182425 RepID=A0A2U2DN12_9HYPH|nr:NnrS family protein [Rhizobium album]PWE54691.1 short-chain dehydrogenase [Rhizobium album]
MGNADQIASPRRGAVPRGLSTTGPILFSYGFRPFFLGAAVWACTAMCLWILALTGRLDLAEGYGAHAWHQHEMLFGFASAVLAGFLLTAVPNWTGRLPVSGRPLILLFSLWVIGRLAMLGPHLTGNILAAAIDSIFLPTLLFICVREIVAGKKWKDLKVVAGLGVLAAANICFHAETILKGAPDFSPRFAIAAYIGLVIIVGGRILPSFTRNWLAKQDTTRFPTPFNRFDTATIAVSVAALLAWAFGPETPLTSLAAGAAAILQAARLYRWRGWATFAEPIVFILHIAYLFVPLGFLAMAASAGGLMDGTAATHVLTIGTVATMMLAVMTRATRGHTGRELHASPMTILSYAAIVACALVRPLTSVFPDQTNLLHAIAGLTWLSAFGLYLCEYGPMLVKKRRQPIGK